MSKVMLSETSQQADCTEIVGSTDLRGRTAVVTGSSRGIGRAIALELARGGADVLVHARSSYTDAEEVCSSILDIGRDTEMVLSDLSQADNLEPFFESAWSWRGGVDIWVNNAGVDVLTGPAANWSFEKKLSQLWQVDVLGTVRLSRFAGRAMQAMPNIEGGRAIINVGWDQAEFGMGGDSGEMFSTVKGAIMAFSRSLAHSLAPKIRVNCLAPGWIRTAWGEQASDDWQARARGESLLERWGTPADVAAAARFLASPAASFLAGQVIAINGGLKLASHLQPSPT